MKFGDNIRRKAVVPWVEIQVLHRVLNWAQERIQADDRIESKRKRKFTREGIMLHTVCSHFSETKSERTKRDIDIEKRQWEGPMLGKFILCIILVSVNYS